MKKKVVVIIAAVLALALVAYFVLPSLLLKRATDSERKAAGLQQKTALIGDHEIAYLEGGRGEAIIMVHGFGANKDNWTRFAKFITPGFHVLALDLPGFGNSTSLEKASYGIVEQAKRLNQFADAIGLQRFHIVGNSMGGLHRGSICSYVFRESDHPGALQYGGCEVSCLKRNGPKNVQRRTQPAHRRIGGGV